jgi:hypothetical protein
LLDTAKEPELRLLTDSKARLYCRIDQRIAAEAQKSSIQAVGSGELEVSDQTGADPSAIPLTEPLANRASRAGGSNQPEQISHADGGLAQEGAGREQARSTGRKGRGRAGRARDPLPQLHSCTPRARSAAQADSPEDPNDLIYECLPKRERKFSYTGFGSYSRRKGTEAFSGVTAPRMQQRLSQTAAGQAAPASTLRSLSKGVLGRLWQSIAFD